MTKLKCQTKLKVQITEAGSFDIQAFGF